MTNEEAKELYYLVVFTLNKNNITPNEDLIQDLVTHVVSKLDLYDESRGSKSTFIVTCIEKKLSHLYRYKMSKKRYMKDYDVSLEDCIFDGITIGDTIESRDDVLMEVIKDDIIEKIKPLIKEPLMLYINGFSQVEIATKLNCNPSNVSHLIKTNIQQIKRYCKQNGIELM